MAVVGAAAVIGASVSSPPTAEATAVQLSTVSRPHTPNPLLAALLECGRRPVATWCGPHVVHGADLSAAIAVLLHRYNSAVTAFIAAHPAAHSGDITLALGLPGLGGSKTNAGWTLIVPLEGSNGFDFGVVSDWRIADQLGPLAFILQNVGTIRFDENSGAPAGRPSVFYASNMTSWFTGVAGLARSAGTVGWLAGSALGSDGGTSAATGILQTANSLGLFVFNLSVLKSMTVSQAPTGTVLPGGQLDAVRAIDIGQWVFGIPGLFTNTGTVGFVADAGGGAGYGTARWVGGLQTTTQIGPFSFTLNFLPSFSFGTSTPTNGSGGTTTGTGSDCGTTNVDANVTAWSLSDGQRSADLWDASTHHDSNVENDADVTPDGSDSSDVATSTAAVRPAATTPVTASETVQTADEPQVVTETAVSSRPRPAGTTELNGAGTPDADSNDQGARHTARENGSPVTNRSIGYIGKHDAADDYLGRHRSDDGYTGKHRSDDGYIGKHRSNDGSASTEASSAQDGLGSTNGESTTPSER